MRSNPSSSGAPTAGQQARCGGTRYIFPSSGLSHRRSGIGLAFYSFVMGKRIVVLHAFIKESQQTPDNVLKMARKRLKEVMHG